MVLKTILANYYVVVTYLTLGQQTLHTDSVACYWAYVPCRIVLADGGDMSCHSKWSRQKRTY